MLILFFFFAEMEEGYELDLTYVTERIIAVSFPQACTEETYLHNLKDVTRMLKSKHADNYLVRHAWVFTHSSSGEMEEAAAQDYRPWRNRFQLVS